MHQYLSVDREMSNAVIRKQLEQKYDTEQSLVGKEKKQSVQRHALRKDRNIDSFNKMVAFQLFLRMDSISNTYVIVPYLYRY